MTRTTRKYTEEEKNSLLDQIDKLIKEGSTQINACAAIGLPKATYGAWKSLKKGKPYPSLYNRKKSNKKPQIIDLPIVPEKEDIDIHMSTSKIALFVGDASEVQKIYDWIFGARL